MSNTRYINRELTWLEFNQRVLDEANNTQVPLMDRLKFLAITYSNLDEFFMVRVGSLNTLTSSNITKRDASGMTPNRQLVAVSKRSRQMINDQYESFNQLMPLLEDIGFKRIDTESIDEKNERYLQDYYNEFLSSILSPQAVDKQKRFPLITNLALYILVRLQPDSGKRTPDFAIIPLTGKLKRLVPLDSENGYKFILLEDIVKYNAAKMFPGRTVAEVVPFRITRSADIAAEEEMSADFLKEMKSILKARRKSKCIRLEADEKISQTSLNFLTNRLKISAKEVYKCDGPLQLKDFMATLGLPGFEEYRDDSWTPQMSPQASPKENIFKTIRRNDILLHHPYDSFEPVIRFLEEAAIDPDVLAIKQTLYRTSDDSPIIAALKTAAANGKYVTALVELKARFDEARNITWAKKLEEAGVQVIYGVKGLKTHSKIAMVVRRESDGIVRYMHFGTGNYNESTAKLYTDISYMTRDAVLGRDASQYFNSITGYSEPQTFRCLEAAPHSLRNKLLELIEGESERCRQGQKGLIRARINSLADPILIEALYQASAAGVKIELNVRGICCLIPKKKALSETINVTSIIDRYLEHSRIIYFHHGGEEMVFISSADWMPRNLDRRAELLVPVRDDKCKKRLLDALDIIFSDTLKAKELQADGSYKSLEKKKKNIRSQEAFYLKACKESDQAVKEDKTTSFEPHLPSNN